MIAQLSSEYIKAKPSKAISRLISYLFFEGRPTATKGRFINPFLFLFYKLIMVFPIVKKIKKPIFIIGMGRSGTTVLGTILSLHKDLGFLNEPKAMWYFANPNDDLIGNYSDGDALYKLNASNADNNTKQKIKKLYAFYLRSIISKRVLDKYPEMIFRVPFLKEIFPEAKFIFIYRNGWDASTSTSTWSEKNAEIKLNNEIHDWWGKNNKKWKLLVKQVASTDSVVRNEMDKIKTMKSHREKSVIEWIVTMNQGHELMLNSDINILPVKYEDLITNSDKVLIEILEYCELSIDKVVLNHAKTILKPNTAKPNFKIEEPIASLFNNVMNKFHYST